MTHVLVDDWLYMDIEGKPGVYGREEVDRGLRSKIKEITASFVECETKVLNVPQGDQAQKEVLINAAFSNEYLIQEEWLASNIVQVIAAQKVKIEEIYRYFKPATISTLVPYPVGIRALLKSSSSLPNDHIVIFIDDLKTQAVITIFEGLRFTSPRRISMRDIGYMISEIKRSKQNYLALRGVQSDGPQPRFGIISNNREWISAFIEQDLVTREEAIHIDQVYPILEGLKRAKFAIHFSLLEEIVRQKKLKIAGQYFKAVLAIVVSCFIGGGLYLASKEYERSAQIRIQQLYVQEQKTTGLLEQMHKQKFMSLLRNEQYLPFGRMYFELLGNIPPDHGVEEFQIQHIDQNQWRISAMVFPSGDSVFHDDLKFHGLFEKAQITVMDINKRSCQRIDLAIDQHQG